jgi:peptidoglycan hydrolase-like protein with peptidoglycan-binding domain
VAVVVAAVVLGGAGAVFVYTSVIKAPASATTSSPDSSAPLAFTTVIRKKLIATTEINGTLSYAGSYSVINWLSGTVTWLPAVGTVVKHGQVLYQVDGKPVIMLRGSSVPTYRALSLSMKGTDVQQLNAELVALGYADKADLAPTSTSFSQATYYAVRRMQKALGLAQTGDVGLGQIVFQPTDELRVTKLNGTYGASIAPGSTFVEATSTTRQVVAAIDVGDSSVIKKGDPVEVILPGTSKPAAATVTQVGSVAQKASTGNGYTVEVDIELTNSIDAGKLDQAPVRVSIQTGSVDNALSVPVTALLALSGGGYALEVVGAGNSRTLVPVQLGMFDDAAGVVQVSGAGLAEGQKVVVPST